MPEKNPNLFDVVGTGPELEPWLKRHDRGEISIIHLIVENGATYRIKGSYRPHKPPARAPLPSECPLSSKPLFKPDAPEDLKALEAKLRAERSVTKPPKPKPKGKQSIFDLWK